MMNLFGQEELLSYFVLKKKNHRSSSIFAYEAFHSSKVDDNFISLAEKALGKHYALILK